jgi:membrane fusion protein (multidrug efflux system)
LVEAGELLFQLDDRLARAAEEQAKAAVDSAKATLAKVKNSPRPEQLALAELAVAKAREGLEFARKVSERQRLLSKTETVPAKAMEVAAHDVEAAQNDVSVAEKQLALLKSSPTPEEVAEASGKVAEAERALGLAQAQRAVLRVAAPLKGTVVRVNAAAGEAVDSTKPLAELVALDRLVVNVSVPAEQMSQLHAGQAAEVVVDALEEHEGEKGEAKKGGAEKGDAAAPAKPQAAVHSVGFAVDRRNNSVPVVVSLPADAGFRPGQFLRVRILADEHAGVLAVPWASVVREEEDKFAIAVVHDEKAARVNVTLGLREGDWVEVAAKELKEGDSVVTEGAYGLPKETKVHVVEDAKDEKGAKDEKNAKDTKDAKDEKK